MQNKFVLAISFLLSQLMANCQDFSRYSHFIFGVYSEHKATIGVFSLIKIESKVYFITAAHVVNGWNSVRNEPEPYQPDTMTLRFTSKTGQFIYFRISTKSLKQNADRTPFYISPDLFIARISLPVDVEIESLDSFMTVDYSKVLPITAFSFGFPAQDKPTYEAMIQRPPLEFSGTFLSGISGAIIFEDKHVVDSMDYALSTDIGAPGFSGAPIFLKDTHGIPYFGGICFGGEEEKHVAYVIKPNIIRKYLLERIRSIPEMLIFK